MANENKLEVGQSRVGLMIDGLPETPRVSVKLERTEDRVEVTIPFLDGIGDVFQYWFSDGIMFGDDPERKNRRYSPPPTVSFYDAHGSVGLVGSRVTGSKLRFGGVGGVGEGRLAFDFTVLGASSGTAYERVNGLRSEVEGLGTWIGLRSLSAEQRIEAGRLASVNLRLESPKTIRAARRLNTEFQANWRYGPGPAPDQTTISERMHIRTQVKRAVSWEEHLRIHFALRNLLRVTAWRPLNFASHEVMSDADPVRTADGAAHGSQWLPVITHRTGVPTGAATKLSSWDLLFTFGDVGSRGVSRWLDVSERFERGLTPLVGLLDLKGASLEAHLAEVGIAYEMLGYDLLVEVGASNTRIKNANFVDLAGAVVAAVADVLPFAAGDFPELLRRTYVGVKHADSARPDRREMNLAYRQAIQVFRAWVAIRLGMSRKRLKVALENDSLSHYIQRLASESSD